jgi:hypothetical protein
MDDNNEYVDDFIHKSIQKHDNKEKEEEEKEEEEKSPSNDLLSKLPWVSTSKLPWEKEIFNTNNVVVDDNEIIERERENEKKEVGKKEVTSFKEILENSGNNTYINNNMNTKENLHKKTQTLIKISHMQKKEITELKKQLKIQSIYMKDTKTYEYIIKKVLKLGRINMIKHYNKSYKTDIIGLNKKFVMKKNRIKEKYRAKKHTFIEKDIKKIKKTYLLKG